ncbi:leucine--tRNA ligase [Candidatus Parcubacteria bacterium]|nr:leucine--tRNA ligase [Candidatus Parcubacteria bacterium]
MQEYNPQKIEEKWQKRWAKDKIFKTKDGSKNPKFYVLDMFPYPSGAGLHVGHPKGYIATDIVSRMKRMQGFEVLHPMGWDGFGLPAENYALKNKIHPKSAVKENIKKFKAQLNKIGFDYDWSREINTTEPNYYKWTQWIFLQMFKKGLAYESYEPINWCPSCKTGLANEDLEHGKCERCGSDIEQKPMRQWVLKITDYAERLLEDLKLLDWEEQILEMQKNWIGKSCGADVDFKIDKRDEIIKVFTTRPDTLFGATFMVLSPEHSSVEEITTNVQKSEVKKYQEQARKKSDLERTDLEKEKTGVFTGAYAINPVNNEKIPIWIADYVLMSYGYGAIMAVPAHDERDFEFAKKFKLPIVQIDLEDKEKMIKWLEKNKNGRRAVNYKLKDWVFSRQRYWGEPIPIIKCEKCGNVAVPEKELPLKLPEVKHYEPTGTGESPLANIKEWVNTTCPKCKKRAKRETNTMPQWAGSCWYYLRYIDPENKKELVDKNKEKYWMKPKGVDLYVGGAEHATRHLIYARFWHKFLQDIGVVSTSEPFHRLFHVGLIAAEDGRKMSKRWNNVINPDDVIQEYGADSLRLYEMFMGGFSEGTAWNTKGLVGTTRFLKKVWQIQYKPKKQSSKSDRLLHQTIKKVTEDIENFKFNTAISQMMILTNEMEKQKEIDINHYLLFLIILAPFAPHISEELWESLKNKKSIFLEKWPEYNPKLIKEETFNLIIQINGKVRDKIEVEAGISEEKAEELALSQEKIKKWLENKKIKKIISVENKLVNIVV